MAATCSACLKEIDWATSPKGQLMPVDRDSAGKEDGNLGVWRDEYNILRCRMLTADAPLRDGEKAGTAHWATCPKAKARRRTR